MPSKKKNMTTDGQLLQFMLYMTKRVLTYNTTIWFWNYKISNPSCKNFPNVNKLQLQNLIPYICDKNNIFRHDQTLI